MSSHDEIRAAHHKRIRAATARFFLECQRSVRDPETGDVDFEYVEEAIYEAITDSEARYSSEMKEITLRIIGDWMQYAADNDLLRVPPD